MIPVPHPVSPLSDRFPGSPDHAVMTWAPGETAKEPQSRISVWAVPVSCPTQQSVPAPSSPLQWRQSLPRTHCHGCWWAAPLCTRATAWHTGRSPQIGSWMQPSLCLVSFSLSSSIQISLSLIYSPFMLLFFVICSHISLSPLLFSRKCCLPI